MTDRTNPRCIHGIPGCTCLEDVPGAPDPPAPDPPADAEEEAAPPTDPQPFVQRIRKAGLGLVAASRAVVEGCMSDPDPDLLSLLRERAVDAARLLWEIESDTTEYEQPEAWDDLVHRGHDPLNAVPVVALALDSPSLTDPNALRPGFGVWVCPGYLALGVGRLMVEWAEKHAAEEVPHV